LIHEGQTEQARRVLEDIVSLYEGDSHLAAVLEQAQTRLRELDADRRK
jgi:hypothetical protein